MVKLSKRILGWDCSEGTFRRSWMRAVDFNEIKSEVVVPTLRSNIHSYVQKMGVERGIGRTQISQAAIPLVMVNGIQFEQDVEMSLTGEVNDLRQVHAEHGRFVEVVLGQDAELRLADQLLRFVDVGSLEKFELLDSRPFHWILVEKLPEDAQWWATWGWAPLWLQWCPRRWRHSA